MPQKTVSEGDTERLFQGTPGSLYYLDSTGNIRLAQTREFARLARVLPAGLDIEITVRSSGAVYAHAEETATITYERQGLSWQPRATQGRTERNQNKSDTIPAGGSQSVTFEADTDEVWTARKFKYRLETTNPDWGGTASEDIAVTVETEEEGIELGFFHVSAVDTGSVIEYLSTGWSTTAGNVLASRDSIESEQRVDDDSGIVVKTEIAFDDTGGNGEDIEATREQAFAFDVIRT